MSTIDEQIWEYIDGTCSPEEKLAIEAKIASDNNYASTYEELMQVHQMLNAEQLDEPSMSFTRNVMDLVDLEIAPVSLKTKVDQRIILSIAAFFGLAFLAIFVYAITHASYSFADFKIPKLQVNFDMSSYITPTFVKIFLFVDLILGLFYLDGFLRRKTLRQAK